MVVVVVWVGWSGREEEMGTRAIGLSPAFLLRVRLCLRFFANFRPKSAVCARVAIGWGKRGANGRTHASDMQSITIGRRPDNAAEAACVCWTGCGSVFQTWDERRRYIRNVSSDDSQG